MNLSPENLKATNRKGRLYPGYLLNETGLAETLIAVYRENLNNRRGDLLQVVYDCEDIGYDYRLVRGLSEVLDSRCIFQTTASVPPLVAREALFKEAARHLVVDEKSRNTVLKKVAQSLNVTAEELDESFYGDLEEESTLMDFNEPTPAALHRFYNYELTIGLLSHASNIEARHIGADDYLVTLAKSIGGVKPTTTRGYSRVTLDLKQTRRLGQRGDRLDKFIARLLTNKEWTINAAVVYPTRLKRKNQLTLTQKDHGGILEKDPYTKEYVFDIAGAIKKKPLRYGDIVILEEVARKQGKTEGMILKEIREEGAKYHDLGGVLVTTEKKQTLSESLQGIETLGAARRALREHGVRNFMPVLEALGYIVEWSKPRSESRVYRL